MSSYRLSRARGDGNCYSPEVVDSLSVDYTPHVVYAYTWRVASSAPRKTLKTLKSQNPARSSRLGQGYVT